MNKFHKLTISRILIWWLVPAGLLFYSGATIFNQIKTTQGLLTVYQGKNFVGLKTDAEIYAGEKITGSFTANYPNLGIIAVRFFNFNRTNDDQMIFRIKKIGSDNWHYENTYRTHQFLPNELFDFGFPVILESQKKSYVFEIESINGKPGNAVSLSVRFPQFIAKYQLTAANLKSNPVNFIRFILIKSYQLIINIEMVRFIAIRLILIISYLYIAMIMDKHFRSLNKMSGKLLLKHTPVNNIQSLALITRNNQLLALFTMTTILFNILIVNNLSGTWLLSGLLLVLLNIVIYKLESRSIINFSTLCLLLYASFVTFSFTKIADNFVIWFYLLLGVGLALKIVGNNNLTD